MQDKNPLVFRTEEIRAKGGLNASLAPDAAEFSDVFEVPGALKRLELELDFSVGGDSVLLEGKIKADLELPCSRCGEQFTRSYEDSFDEVYPNSLEYIDTREVIRETAGMLAPIKVLCAEGCRGRCPVCGCNRNQKQCGCRPEGTSAFEALKDFKPGGPGGSKRKL